jgi:signal transduction histidine kinase/ActR/RegA family two-component response regulator
VPTRQARALGRANAWLLHFLPREPPQGDDLRRALVTGAVACLFLGVAPVYAALSALFDPPPAIYYGLVVATVVGCSGALALLKLGRVRAAAWLLLLTGTTATALTALREGASAQAAGNLVLPVVMAVLLIGWRAALLIGVPALALITILGLLERAGVYHPAIVTHHFGVFALVQVGAVMVMLAVFDGVRLGLVRAQRELEAQLARAGRLEAVGRVAGGVAHDFNNLLTIILANASLLAESAPAESGVQDIAAAAQRGAQLTKQLLAFARQQKLEPRAFDLAALVDEERSLLARLIPESITIDVTRPSGTVLAHADPGQISQVLLNLVVNARDAMPAGGRIHLVVAPVRDTFVTLEVRDTGHGMDAQTLERAFEPFFTTKGTVGTGLGLATVHGIVTQSGGQVRVRSGPGGTTFEVTLPAAAAAVPAARPQSSGELERGQRRTILLVEDDAGVRQATARLLQSLGHDVVAHADIAGALGAWRARPTAFAAILSDVVMPGGGGPELVRALPAQARARVLFMSGYPNDALDAPDLQRVPFLAKPFTERELAAKLAEILWADASGPEEAERRIPRS